MVFSSVGTEQRLFQHLLEGTETQGHVEMPYIANLSCSVFNIMRRFEEMLFISEDVASD
jgi:hypothetical protein